MGGEQIREVFSSAWCGRRNSILDDFRLGRNPVFSRIRWQRGLLKFRWLFCPNDVAPEWAVLRTCRFRGLAANTSSWFQRVSILKFTSQTHNNQVRFKFRRTSILSNTNHPNFYPRRHSNWTKMNFPSRTSFKKCPSTDTQPQIIDLSPWLHSRQWLSVTSCFFFSNYL